jgi:hypothetical protein
MTNEQLGAFIIANAVTLWAIFKWGFKQAVDYTHKLRDIKELQDFREEQKKTNEKFVNDLKGVSMKIDGKKP